MKLRLILPGLMVILALSLPACAAVAKEVPLQVSYDDFAQSKSLTRSVSNVLVGDVVKVTLPSNPSTGFKWELVSISVPTVLKQDGESDYELPESPAIGAGGQEIWTFKALKRGTSAVSLVYSQPWAGGTKAAWKIDINVSIK